MDALACGATAPACDTEPVREMITRDQNGLLGDLLDVDGWAVLA